jgi:hypothetical protein
MLRRLVYAMQKPNYKQLFHLAKPDEIIVPD